MERRGANVLMDSGAALRFAPTLDITNDVLAALNAALTSVATTAPAQPQQQPAGPVNEAATGAAIGPLDIRRVMAALPHRYPMLLVDRVETIVPDQSITAIKAVSMNEGFFQGHFPGRPIMPGVLIVEALAQAAGILAVESLGLADSGKLVYFMAIEGAKFRTPVEPGCLLQLDVEFVQKRATVCKFAGKASVDGKLAAEANFTAMIADPPAPDRPASVRRADPEDFLEALAGHQVWRALRPSATLPPAISSARSKRRQQAEVVERDERPPGRSELRSRNRSQQPQHPIGVEVGERLVEQQQLAARAASARAVSTRARSPVDSRSTGRSARASKLELVDQLGRRAPHRAGRGRARSRRGRRSARRHRARRGGRQRRRRRRAGGAASTSSPSISDRAGGLLDPGQRAQQAGLAAAVGADQRDHFARRRPCRSVGRAGRQCAHRLASSDVMTSPSAAWSAPARGTAACRTAR